MRAIEFQLPPAFDLVATFAFALTGALAGARRGYDIVGVFFLALATGIGGGLIRDGVFIHSAGPTPLLTDPRYLLIVVAATTVGAFFGSRIARIHRIIALFDALGLGAYAAFGTQKALQAGVAVPAAILVGVINAAGGGLLRDILTRQEPLVFKPGQFYVLVALAGSVTFVFLTAFTPLTATASALISVGVTFLLRTLTIAFNWRTSRVPPPEDLPAAPPSTAEHPAETHSSDRRD